MKGETMAMSSESKAVLKHADRHSEAVRLVFRDGAEATARIRDLDWDTHRTLTYLDMDGACGARIVLLDEIASVEPAADWDRQGSVPNIPGA